MAFARHQFHSHQPAPRPALEDLRPRGTSWRAIAGTRYAHPAHLWWPFGLARDRAALRNGWA
ncbi:MAG: hypothetical protein M3Y64_05480, partial [Gemmatimonadota bacterium]|nr:hypothetical protein [Gemmatimonadota bacterium]